MQINIMIYAREPHFEVYHTAYNNNHNDDFDMCEEAHQKKRIWARICWILLIHSFFFNINTGRNERSMPFYGAWIFSFHIKPPFLSFLTHFLAVYVSRCSSGYEWIMSVWKIYDLLLSCDMRIIKLFFCWLFCWNLRGFYERYLRYGSKWPRDGLLFSIQALK